METTAVPVFLDACSGLQEYLNQQGFHVAAHGCATCVGNSGDLDESVSAAITENGTVHIYSYICVAMNTTLLNIYILVHL
jgi:hypothetical protein